MEANEQQGTHVVTIGNPFDGMQLWGPFPSALEAADWAREQNLSEEWMVVPVWRPVE